MIINTGLRTDIPAFYTPWLLDRLREGFVLVRSPYAPTTLTCYRLDPAVVDLIAFCTKNPGPMLPHLGELRRYAGQYWFVTITPYGREIEPRVPEKRRVVADFRALSRAVGVDSVGWRYDPILLNETYHTGIYLGGGLLANASGNENGEATGGEPGDQTGREIWVRPYYDYPWDGVLRPKNYVA